jgi:peptidyl-Asp metalloendopeptidase
VKLVLNQENGMTISSSTAEIDILGVYTQDAADASIRADLVAQVERLNSAFSASQINAVANLVHIQEVNYVESGNASTDLNRLFFLGDGHLDDALLLRNGLGADIICLIVNSSDHAGAANLLTQFNQGFKNHNSLIRRDALANSWYILAHEIGHNLGGHHNREELQAGDEGYFPAYSYGYRSVNGGFSTVLAYPIQGYPQIGHFSNPNVNYNGNPTGIEDPASNAADNAATFNYTAPIVAGWRSPTKLISPQFSSGNFQFTITGPTSSGTVLHSSDLEIWNPNGPGATGIYTDYGAGQNDHRFYRSNRDTSDPDAKDFTSANIIGFASQS